MRHRRNGAQGGSGAAVVRGLLASVVCAASSVGAAAPVTPVQVPDTLAQRLQPCMACHGPEGRASPQGYLPRIAGKPAAYLFQQLLNFRDGRRSNSAMAGFLALQRDDYLREMAGYFAALDLPYPGPAQTTEVAASPAQLARGAQLAHHGDPARGLPACSACHGSALGGMLPAVPGLLGLPRDYLIAQLGAWQTGQRHATAPDCMGQIATQLTASEISAIATWLSAQTLPAQSKALPGRTTDWPLECGSRSGTP